jgi:hypothetical protein
MSDPHLFRLHDLDYADEPADRTACRRPAPVDRGVTEPIDGRLGHLSVDEHGALTDVDLDEHALRRMRPDSVADHLVAAIARAQARAGAARRTPDRSERP